ncbi:MAG: hypothetical protein AAF724_03475 [Pseudomonadota bacterium]
MNLIRAALFGMAISLSFSLPKSVSYAQTTEGDCLCLVDASNQEQSIGALLEALGDIRVSQTAGFTPGTTGTPLRRGDQIIVGPQSSALVSVGPTCRLQLPENTDIVLEPLEDRICVRPTNGSGQASSFDRAGGIGTGIFMLYGVIRAVSH